MKVIYSVLFSLFMVSSYAQIGVSAKYNSNDFPTWNSLFFAPNNISDGTGFSSSYEVGLNYRYRLKKKHVDFLPEISYAKAFTNRHEFPDTENRLDLSSLIFTLQTNIYLLDFNNGCDCPTFSNQSDVLSKGLHLIISPAFTTSKTAYEIRNSGNPQTIINGSFSERDFKMGIGAGLDLGVNDHFTITPFVMYHAIQSISSDYVNNYIANTCLDPSCEFINETTQWKQIQVGLRFSFQ